MAQFEAHRATAEIVAAAYGCFESLSFAYAQGSLVEGLATEGDLDVVLVWSGAPPPSAERLPVHITDALPQPTVFEQPGFNVDRFFVGGQQIDVKHVTAAEVDSWWADVCTGAGVSGYPMPAIAIHGLTTGAIINDSAGAGADYVQRFSVVPKAFVDATTARAGAALPPFLEELERCVQRGDGLLLHDQLVQLVRTLFIAWFAAQGRWWPHEKRLSARLRRLGRGDLAQLEESIWQGEPAQRVLAVRQLSDALTR